MSSRHNSARHRAQTVRTNPLDTVSKAVSANAGTVGRQAAVIAAASGLILSMGLPANAADTTAGVSASTESGSAQSALAVTAAPTATVSFERPVVKTTAAPKPAPVRAQSTASERSTASESRAASGTRAASTAAAPEAAADKPAESVSSASASTSGIAALAYTGIGRPYVWGGTTPNGWDCSGFTQWVYAQAGISIPRVNAWTAMTPTSTPQPGDLVMQNGGAHVGIYVGNGMMVSALNPSQGTLLHSVAATGSSAFFTINK